MDAQLLTLSIFHIYFFSFFFLIHFITGFTGHGHLSLFIHLIHLETSVHIAESCMERSVLLNVDMGIVFVLWYEKNGS